MITIGLTLMSEMLKGLSHIFFTKGVENETYNVLSDNYKCREIIDIIREYIPDLKVNMVKTPFINQFSYLVDDTKISNTGINLNGSIKRGIKETLGIAKMRKKILISGGLWQVCKTIINSWF
jgi:hypothetical protein